MQSITFSPVLRCELNENCYSPLDSSGWPVVGVLQVVSVWRKKWIMVFPWCNPAGLHFPEHSVIRNHSLCNSPSLFLSSTLPRKHSLPRSLFLSPHLQAPSPGHVSSPTFATTFAIWLFLSSFFLALLWCFRSHMQLPQPIFTILYLYQPLAEPLKPHSLASDQHGMAYVFGKWFIWFQLLSFILKIVLPAMTQPKQIKNIIFILQIIPA